MKNKKGVTLVELVCGLAVLSIALLVGIQVLVTAARSSTRATTLEKAVGEVSQYFETGTPSEAVADATAQENGSISFTLSGTGGAHMQIQVPLTTVVLKKDAAQVTSKMVIATNSIGAK